MGWNPTKTQGEKHLEVSHKGERSRRNESHKGKDSSLSVCVRKGIDNWREGK